MNVPIISREASLPYLPDCLKSIIEKKVNLISLNFFENIVDLFFTYFCCHSYNQWYGYRLAESESISARSQNQTMLHLSDGTPVIVRAIGVEVTIRPDTYISLPQRDEIPMDIFYLNGKRVVFNPQGYLLFSREAGTELITIENSEGNPLYLRFTENERNLQTGSVSQKSWTIDLNKIFIYRNFAREIPFPDEEVFVVEEQVPNAWHPVYSRFLGV